MRNAPIPTDRLNERLVGQRPFIASNRRTPGADRLVTQSRISHGSDDVRPDLAVGWSRPEMPGDCGCRNIRRLHQPIGIVALGLIPHRCASAISNRDRQCAGCPTLRCDDLRRYSRKSRRAQPGCQGCGVAVSMWGTSQKHRWIVRKQGRDGFHHDIGEPVLLNPIPDIEQEASAWLQYPIGFGESLPLVRAEHHTELAHHGVELHIRKR